MNKIITRQSLSLSEERGERGAEVFGALLGFALLICTLGLRSPSGDPHHRYVCSSGSRGYDADELSRC